MHRIISCSATKPETEVLEQIEKILRDGQAVVLPTETQYSLSVRADRRDVLDQIGKIKKRDLTQKSALFVKDMEMASLFCDISETASALARKFLPGPLTLVLPERIDQKVVDSQLASDDGFGIRISSAPIIRETISRLEFPITATSANISGTMPHATINDIAEELGDLIALYVDGGRSPGRTPSTVVKFGNSENDAGMLEILRPGQIPATELRNYLKELGR